MTTDPANKPLRRAGAPWRILVHEWLGKKGVEETGFPCGTAYDVTSQRRFGRPYTGNEPDTEHSKTVELPGTEFDELVIGRWIHLEQMNTGTWWMNIGGVTLWVKADRDGRPVSVSVHGPDRYAEAVPGCSYDLDWVEPVAEETA